MNKLSLLNAVGRARHALSHNAGGADPLPVDAAAATGSMRTIGNGALQAAAGDHTTGSHSGTITDTQHGVRTTANAHAYSHISGTHGDSAHTAVYASEDDVKKWALIG